MILDNLILVTFWIGVGTIAYAVIRVALTLVRAVLA